MMVTQSRQPRLEPIVPAGRFNWQVRLPAAIVCLCAVSVLSLAASLSPSPRGYGTHTQVGMEPCGFVKTAGMPCATCGMTTAFAHAADGRLLASALTQPAGAALAVLTAMAAIISGYAALVGLSLGPLLRWIWRPRFVVVMGALIMAAWGYKILTFTGS